MFEAFYTSPWQHPTLLLLFPILFAVVRRRALMGAALPSWLRAYLGFWLLETCLDALLTAEISQKPLGLTPGLGQAIAIVFVILGDLRVWLLLALLATPRLGPPAWGKILALSLAVPVVQGVLGALLPAAFPTARHTFLTYELLFLCLIGAVWRSRLFRETPLREPILGYAAIYYLLWATSDVLIFTGLDAGFLLRTVPNVLYYGLFIPFVLSRWEGKGHSFRNVAVLVTLGALLSGCAPEPCSEPRPPSRSAVAPPISPTPLLFKTTAQSRKETISSALQALGPAAEVSSADPYYQAEKRFLGFPAQQFLAWAFPGEGLEGEQVLRLRASDGYEVTLGLDQLLKDEAYFVFAEAGPERPLPPIGPRRTDPAPLYLIWKGQAHQNLTTHPRPFCIVEIEKAERKVNLHFGPPGSFPAETAEARGLTLFTERCVRCHALDQRGGHVGPDLNAPQNILDYRPEDQVRAYIRDPATFRYGAMPSHLDLSDAQLGELVAFLRAMKQHRPAAPMPPKSHGALGK
jgi:mono/diheme cytochrome c family protein